VVVALRDVARLAGSARSAPDPAAQVRLRGDGLYVVSGGMGGFGLATARWLVDRGARQVALLGRRIPADVWDHPSIAAIRAHGAEVIVASVDVTDRAQVKGFLDSMRAAGRVVRGVVHAAMVLQDTLIDQLDAATLDRVMAPKVRGAWHLHAETLADPVELFIMFSSLTSILGNPGQANYVAGNAFLDEFAGYRRSLGLPGLTVNWGGISEVGFVARQSGAAAQLEQRGVGLLTPDRAFAALDRLLARQAVSGAAAEIDWHRVRDNWTIVSPRWAGLLPEAELEGPAAASSGDLVRQMLQEASAERSELVVHWLVDRLSRVLGLQPAAIDADRSMSEVGLDSLMAMELRIRIESELGIDVPVLQLVQADSLRQVAANLEAQLTADRQPGSTGPSGGPG
jgi:NAD(P)-dependent dehydrogenase (short-subunit alcohol dehydrogenase family)/acyl carrier protein